MKKITLLFLFMWTMLSQAQLKDYIFSATAGSYSEITTQGGATTLGDATASTQVYVDPGSSLGGATTAGPGFDIGFSFTFDGRSYDKFGISNAGWISLGSSLITPNHVDMGVTNNLLPLSSTSTTQPNNLCAIIAAITNNLAAQPGASLSYQTLGTSPNRTLVIQWKKYMKGTNGSGDSFDFQIRLNETTNVIQFVYGTFQVNANVLNFQVGLRSAPANAATNFAILKSAVGWSNPPLGTVTTDKMRLDNVNYPQPSGLTYTWTPPTCGSVTNLIASNITDTTASLAWGYNTPNPSGYEYVVSASSTLPTSGTTTTLTTANATGLNPNTNYNVFTRTTCSASSPSQWKLTGTFTTLCTPVTTLVEDFDSNNSGMPDCWSKTGTSNNASCYITSGSTTPGSAPNRLYLNADGSGTNPTVAYAILPLMSNLQAGTHRIKFKAYAEIYQTGRTLDIGYFLDSSNVNTFQVIQTVSLPSESANAASFSFPVTALPTGVKNLAFRNVGLPTDKTTAYVDDVVWEPNSTCADITNVAANGTTNNSAKISWSAAGTTAWQYVYASPAVKNPYNLNGIDVSGTTPTVQITGLTTSTSYKVWVRSNCGGGKYGAWSEPTVFATTCDAISILSENFDTSSQLPVCWRKVGNTGNASISSSTSPLPPSSPNVLSLSGTDASPITIIALPPLNTAQAGTHQLRFNVRGSSAGLQLDLGYLTDVADANTFVNLQQSIITETSFVSKQIKLGTSPKSAYLAFRNLGTDAIYIDNVIWEPLPSCSDVANIVETVSSDSVSLHWTTDGTETQWQYILGSPSDMNPFLLNPLPMPNPVKDLTGFKAVINGLSSNTGYKLWIRSNCGGSAFGSWTESISLMTTCAPGTDFTEHFDGATALPSCWTRSGITGNAVSVGSTQVGITAPSAPYILKLDAGANTGPAVVAMPAMSNTAAGTHRLDFKYRSENGVGKLEVGYLLNIADPTSFVPLGIPFTCTNAFQVGTIELGTDPASQILAFRNSGSPSCVINIDDVIWAPLPPCEYILNPVIASVGYNTINFKWTKGASETAWQYAVGTASATDTNGLTFYDVLDNPVAQASHLSASVPMSATTSYKIWVRAKCSATSFSTWVGPIMATTTCNGVDSFTEDFNAGVIPDCWTKIGTQGNIGFNMSSSEIDDKLKLIMYSGSETQTSILAMPPLSNAGTGDHMLKFRFKSVNKGNKIQVGFISNILDPASFTLINTYENSSDTTSDVVTVSLGTSPVSNIIAFRNPGINTDVILIDDVSWFKVQTTPPACATNVTATTNANCGNYATVISWDAVSGADGYMVDISKASDGTFVLKDQKVGTEATYSFIGDYNTTYNYAVRPYNLIGEAHGCTPSSFTTVANGCYCISAPAAVDYDGITAIKLGAIDFVNTKVTYSDFSAKSVNLAKGATVDLDISFGTKLPYNTLIWIDFNNNFSFDDNEIVYTGATANSPIITILDASFGIKTDAALGMHKMRIVTWSGPLTAGNPCYSGPYGATLDFNVNIVDAVSNDNSLTAQLLQVGTDFASTAITSSNINATGSVQEPTPYCGNYNGNDVWYKAIVPNSGRITFEVNSILGGLTNTAAAVYSGASAALILETCDDSSSTASANQPKISLTDRTPGEVLYLRVWENADDASGAFLVSAYDNAVLGLNTYNTANFLCYPNPVRDIFNITCDQDIQDVAVMNLLGQQVITQSVNANKAQIDMSGLSKGTYLIKVTAANQCKTFKMIKE